MLNAVKMSRSNPRSAVIVGIILFVVFLSYFFRAAQWVPSQFGIDGYLVTDAVDYYLHERRIPVVDAQDQEIEFSQIGTTRLLRPPLTYLLSAAVVGATDSTFVKKSVRYRLASVVLAALTVSALFASCFLLTKHLAMSLLGALCLGLLPRFTILASTKNDDIGAIASVAVLLLAVVWWHQTYSAKARLFLAAAIGFIFISKYTAWLCLLGFAVMLVPKFRRLVEVSPRHLFAAILLSVVFGLWWPLWNMFHYGWLDPGALKHAAEIQNLLTETEANRRGYWSHGVNLAQLLHNHDGFLSTTFQSLVGSLWWLKASVVDAHLWFYACLMIVAMGAALVGSVVKNRLRWLYTGTLALCMTLLISYVHHNLLRDIQADGRYLLIVLGPLIAAVLCAVKQVSFITFQDVSSRLKATSAATALVTIFCLVLILHLISMQSLLNSVRA